MELRKGIIVELRLKSSRSFKYCLKFREVFLLHVFSFYGFVIVYRCFGVELSFIGPVLLYLAHRGSNQSGAEKDNRLLFREQ